MDGAIGDFHLYKKLAPDTKDLLDKVQQVLKRLVKGKAQGVVLDTFKRFRWMTESRSMQIQFKDFQRGLQRMAFYDLDERCAEFKSHFAPFLRITFRSEDVVFVVIIVSLFFLPPSLPPCCLEPYMISHTSSLSRTPSTLLTFFLLTVTMYDHSF